MKQFIITEEQIQKLANQVANIPTAQGMPIIDILRSLPLLPVPDIKEEFHQVTTDEIKGK